MSYELPTFNFSFEELPLVIEDGFEAGLVNGSALIAFDENEFFIKTIWLDGSKKRLNIVGHHIGFDQRDIELDRNSWLFRAIGHQLENGRFRSSIETEIEKHKQPSPRFISSRERVVRELV